MRWRTFTRTFIIAVTVLTIALAILLGRTGHRVGPVPPTPAPHASPTCAAGRVCRH